MIAVRHSAFFARPRSQIRRARRAASRHLECYNRISPRAAVVAPVGINALISQNLFAHFVAKTKSLCYKFLLVGLISRRPGAIALGY
jgi:hypothetical protein